MRTSMRGRYGRWLVASLCALLAPLEAAAEDTDAVRLLRRAEDILYPSSFHMRVSMTTTSPGRPDRLLRIDVLHKEGMGTYMEILEPARSRGLRFLQLQDALWMFNSRSSTGKPIRLSPADSFQGSVFSNNDISDSRYSDDYDVTLRPDSVDLEHPEEGRVVCRLLTGTARTSQAPYGTITLWVRDVDGMPMRMEYTSRSGLLFKTTVFGGFRALAGRTRPSVMTMRSLEREGDVTSVTIEAMEERSDLSAATFTQSHLTR